MLTLRVTWKSDCDAYITDREPAGVVHLELVNPDTTAAAVTCFRWALDQGRYERTLVISAARVFKASTRMRQICHAAATAARAPARAANAFQSTSTPVVSNDGRATGTEPQ